MSNHHPFEKEETGGSIFAVFCFVVMILSFIALIIYGSINGQKIHDANYNEAVGLTNEQLAQQSKVCIDAGLDVFFRRIHDRYESKVTSVQCIPRKVSQQSIGHSDGAMVGAVVGGAVVGHLLSK